VRSLEVILLGRSGQPQKALELARQAIADKAYDYDLVNAAFVLAWRSGDHAGAEQAMQLRMKDWPQTRALGYVQLGTFYATEVRDPDKAMAAYRQAVALASPQEAAAFRAQIPPQFHAQLGLTRSTPPAQTSSSSR